MLEKILKWMLRGCIIAGPAVFAWCGYELYQAEKTRREYEALRESIEKEVADFYSRGW